MGSGIFTLFLQSHGEWRAGIVQYARILGHGQYQHSSQLQHKAGNLLLIQNELFLFFFHNKWYEIAGMSVIPEFYRWFTLQVGQSEEIAVNSSAC